VSGTLSPSPSPPSVVILGLGSYAPAQIVTNDDLAHRVETSDEWIRARTGIRERRIAADDETTSDLGAQASRRAIAAAGLTPKDIDLVIVATITPDMPFPSTACLIQHKLGMRNVPAFDLEAACSGFLYTLDVAAALLRAGPYRHVLVVGAEKLSSIIDWQDRTTCVLFGDGAGAVVLGLDPRPGLGLLASRLGADGGDGDKLCQPGGGSAQPASLASVESRQHFLKMQGREIFKSAVRVMEQSALELLESEGLRPDDVALVIPHQANSRIIDAIRERLELPPERVFLNLDRYGNTSAASIPLALDEAVQSGRLRPGDLVLLVAFGAGLTWGSTLLKWT